MTNQQSTIDPFKTNPFNNLQPINNNYKISQDKFTYQISFNYISNGFYYLGQKIVSLITVIPWEKIIFVFIMAKFMKGFTKCLNNQSLKLIQPEDNYNTRKRKRRILTETLMSGLLFGIISVLQAFEYPLSFVY